MDAIRSVLFPSATAIVVVFAVAALMLQTRWIRGRLVRRAVLWAPWIIGVALVLRFRWWTFLVQREFNLDEAQFLAGAVKILKGYPVPWTDIDMGTVGYLVPLSLTPSTAIAPAAPYVGARLLIVLCAVAWTIGVALLLHRAVGWPAAQALASPLLALLAMPANLEAFAYSAEMPAIALVVLGFGVAWAWADRAQGLVIGGVLLGLVPFAKLQAAPVALVAALAVYTGLLATRRLTRRRAVMFAAGGLAPAAIVAVVLLLVPSVRTAFFGNAQFLRDYSTGDAVFARQGVSETLPVYLDGVLRPALVFLAVLAAASIAVVIHRGGAFARDRAILFASVAVGAVGVVAMLTPGHTFPHYVWIGVVPVFLAVAALSGVVVSAFDGRTAMVLICLALLGSIVVFSRGGNVIGGIGTVSKTRTLLPAGWPVTRLTDLRDGTLGDVHAAVAGCRGPVGVWGWNPNAIVAADVAYATPWAVITRPLDPSATRWFGLMLANPPDCLMDTARKGDFYFGPNDALNRMPDGAKLLEQYDTVLDTPEYRVYRLKGAE